MVLVITLLGSGAGGKGILQGLCEKEINYTDRTPDGGGGPRNQKKKMN